VGREAWCFKCTPIVRPRWGAYDAPAGPYSRMVRGIPSPHTLPPSTHRCFGLGAGLLRLDLAASWLILFFPWSWDVSWNCPYVYTSYITAAISQQQLIFIKRARRDAGIITYCRRSYDIGAFTVRETATVQKPAGAFAFCDGEGDTAHFSLPMFLVEDRTPLCIQSMRYLGQLFLYTASVVLRRGRPMHVVCLHLQHIRRI